MADSLDDALNAARKAVKFDSNNQYKQALYYYKIALNCISKLSLDSAYVDKIAEYTKRIASIETYVNDEEEKQHKPQLPNDTESIKCKFLFNEALNADEAGLNDIAIKLYIEAAEIGLKVKTFDVENKKKLNDIIRHALERGEFLKRKRNESNCDTDDIVTKLANLPIVDTDFPDVNTNIHTTSSNSINKKSPNHHKSLHRGSSRHLEIVGGSSSYTTEEKTVLLHSSHINDHEFVPFMNVDLAERFQYAIPFTDKDGLLELAPKQKLDFARWCRPEELFSDPKMVVGPQVDYYSIKQNVVSDCSFVASLAVSAQYEKRFGSRLITSIIYPKNRNNEPVYNPFGKYMVKLHVNGIPRKVIIDDLLPISRRNQLLCSSSNNRGELWISLLEKAYMKVMGGYDFPGSNSNIDLHALTGWIPERWAVRQDESDVSKNKMFDLLMSRLQKGHVLVTVATGELSDAEADRTGLVPTHAYAVLDIKNIQDRRLLLLKNPWSHLRWRGNYSELDTKHWTSELKEALNYDPDSASQFDNGIFWIDFESICRFFDVFYLNWNPGLFNYTYCIHQTWNAGVGPVKDAYNIGDNPQFLLEIPKNVTGAVWILLTRHITDIADFRQNQEYITLLVYKTNGKRVYYPREPPPYIDGVRINSPHYLCKIALPDDSHSRYTLVVSQYEKTTTIYYTLRAYGMCEFSLKKIPQFYKYEKEITDGQWIDTNAGGCRNHSSYLNNPRYEIKIESSCYLLIILKAPKQYQIGFDLITIESNDMNALMHFEYKHSGPHRSGFVYLEMDEISSGVYHLIPSTYLPNQDGPFFLIFKSSSGLKVERIQ